MSYINKTDKSREDDRPDITGDLYDTSDGIGDDFDSYDDFDDFTDIDSIGGVDDIIEEVILSSNSLDDDLLSVTHITASTEDKSDDGEAAEKRAPEEPEQSAGPVGFLYDLITGWGEHFCYVALMSVVMPARLIAMLGKFLWQHTALFRKAVMDTVKAIWLFFASPLLKSVRVLKGTRKKIREAQKNGDKRTVKRLKLLIFRDMLIGRRGILVTVFNYGAPIIAIVFLMNVVGYATSTDYAIHLKVNGKFVGYIQSEQVFTDAERIMQERITYMDSDEAVTVVPEYSLEMLGDQEYLTKFQLANKMMELSDTPIEYAYGMYIDGRFYGALVDHEKIDRELERILASYKVGAGEEDVAFVKDIEYVPGLYLEGSTVTEEEIIKLLNSKVQDASYYTVAEGDSLQLICEKLHISIEELEALNPGITDEDRELRVGERLLETYEVPFMSVSISRIEVYEVSVPYSTEYVPDDTHYQGVNQLIQEGENGTNEITAKVYYVNEKEIKRTIIKTTRTLDPVTEIISEGTLAPQSSHYSPDSVEMGMKYIWPTDGGYLEEWTVWDGGYYYHTGVDIANSYGSDVYAGAAGTVTYAGWDNGGYGNLVMIQHPDGYTTVYGHNSEIFVYVGQQVAQGQCIAAVGATGRAYGNHVHFEVRYGSDRLNPRYYLSGLQDLYASGYLQY